MSSTSATPPRSSCARKSWLIWKSTCSVCLGGKRRMRTGLPALPHARLRGESARCLAGSRGLTWRLAVAQCRVGGRLAQVRQGPSTVFVAETLPMKRPVRPPAAGAQQLEAGGRSGEAGVAASCIKMVATSPPPAAAPRSSAASTVSTTQQHEYLGGQRRRLGGASSSMRGEAFTSGASCSMFAQVCAPRVNVGLVGHFRPRGFWASGQLVIDGRVQPGPGRAERARQRALSWRVASRNLSMFFA